MTEYNKHQCKKASEIKGIPRLELANDLQTETNKKKSKTKKAYAFSDENTTTVGSIGLKRLWR